MARGITKLVIDLLPMSSHTAPVISKKALLEAVEEVAASRAEIARVLTVAPARITEMFKGDRDLSFEEARRLIEHYDLGEIAGAPSSDSLAEAHGVSFVEEVDLALGMGGGAFAELAESKGLVPFKSEWLDGLHDGALSQLRVVRGRGDSMQPTILDGDLVLVDMAQATVLDQDMI